MKIACRYAAYRLHIDVIKRLQKIPIAEPVEKTWERRVARVVIHSREV
jgi:hypothetical protein